MKNVLVTGVSGFVGKACYIEAQRCGRFNVTGSVRTSSSLDEKSFFYSGSISSSTDWKVALTDISVVAHIAGMAHGSGADNGQELHEVNCEATLNLAMQAAINGVKRFVFLSSIGVNGTFSNQPFTEEDNPDPTGAYARSKWDAEQGLWRIHEKTGMEIVIIRPPLVYGYNAPGKFGSLVRLVEKCVPLPLGAVKNKRSFVSLDNLVDLIISCFEHPAAANQVYLAGDGEDISTTDLLRGVAKSIGKPSFLVPVPAYMLRFAATALGKKGLADGFLGNLQVDISKARRMLGWEPPFSVEEGHRRCHNKEKLN